MNTYFHAFIAALVAAALSGDAIAQAYKYKDEKGGVVFSDQPPPAGQAGEVVKLEKSPAVQTEEPDAVRSEARKIMQEGSKERSEAEASRKQAKGQDAQRKQACEQARGRLEELTTGPPSRRLVQQADGTPRRVGADEMAALIDAARGDVTRACGSK